MNLFRNIKNFIQRGKRGWADDDTWNLDWYLARVISETTKHLSENNVGCPRELSQNKWEKILNQISKDIVVKDDYNTEEQQLKAYEKRKEALELFVKYFNFLWD